MTKATVVDKNGKPYNRTWMLITIIIGLFGSFLAGTMLATAYPTLMKYFSVSASTVQELSTIFMLVTGIMIPITAWMMNRFNSKWIFITGILMYFIGNLICCVSTTFDMMLFGRVISALGGGILTPLGQSIVMTIFPPNERGKAMGFIGLSIGLAPALGPTLSGWIVDNLNWRWIFGITLPIIAIDILLSFIFIKKVLDYKDVKLDTLSAVLSVVGFGAFLYGTSQAGNDGWLSAKVIWSLIIGIIGIFLFCWRQTKLEKPFLDIKLLTRWHFFLPSLLGSIARITLVGVELVLPLYIQIVRNESALNSGLILLPGAILIGLLSPVAGALFDKLGAKHLAIVGLILLTVGTLNFITLSATTPIIEIIVFYAVRMMGIVMVMMPSNTAAMNSLSLQEMNDGSAINNTLRQVLSAIGTAIFTTIYSNIMNDNKPSKVILHQTPLLYKHKMIMAALSGYHATFFAAALSGVIGLILALFLKKHAGLIKKDINNPKVKN